MTVPKKKHRSMRVKSPARFDDSLVMEALLPKTDGRSRDEVNENEEDDVGEQRGFIIRGDAHSRVQLIAGLHTALILVGGLYISILLMGRADGITRFDKEDIDISDYWKFVSPEVYEELKQLRTDAAQNGTTETLETLKLVGIFSGTELQLLFGLLLLIGTNFDSVKCLKVWRVYAVLGIISLIILIGIWIWLLADPGLSSVVSMTSVGFSLGVSVLALLLLSISIRVVSRRQEEILILSRS